MPKQWLCELNMYALDLQKGFSQFKFLLGLRLFWSFIGFPESLN
jgi:hypothetical protein